METEQALDFMETVEGWFTREEGQLLFEVARSSSGAIVEVGSWKGRSTCLLGWAAELTPARVVWAIDPHDGQIDGSQAGTAETFSDFEETLRRASLQQVVRAVRQRSYEVAWEGDPIGLLFIDGLHDEESVARDFQHFERWIPSGGFAAFHDCQYAYPGVLAVVQSLLKSGRWAHAARANSLSVLRRCQ
jgi:predicted O-methyltransferase YrrM